MSARRIGPLIARVTDRVRAVSPDLTPAQVSDLTVIVVELLREHHDRCCNVVASFATGTAMDLERARALERVRP